MKNRKWFLLAHLLSLSVFDFSKILECCFLTKIIRLSGRGKSYVLLGTIGGMFCERENDRQCEYFRTQKFKNVAF